jgi:predicted phosphoribosyltransferase
MTFVSREEAGLELGRHLAERNVPADVILGLPRGGVVVAAEVARVLARPLGVLVVRKIGHPRHREYAVGALAEHDVILLDDAAMLETHVVQSELNDIITEESGRLHTYESRFHQADEPSLADKFVIIVDDGLATGATAEAAVRSAQKQMARAVMIAVPVASTEAFSRLQAVADEVLALVVDADFSAVGQYYNYFPQNTDEEVMALLHTHA